jgi:hypothetical protein
MNRREFTTLLAAASLTRPVPGHAQQQQTQVPVIK